MIQALALLAQVAIIGAYARSTRRADPLPFNRANALGAPLILLAMAAAGAWATMPLTVAFGSIGAWGWMRNRREAG